MCRCFWRGDPPSCFFFLRVGRAPCRTALRDRKSFSSRGSTHTWAERISSLMNENWQNFTLRRRCMLRKDACYGMIRALMAGILPIFTRERKTASRVGRLVWQRWFDFDISTGKFEFCFAFVPKEILIDPPIVVVFDRSFERKRGHLWKERGSEESHQVSVISEISSVQRMLMCVHIISSCDGSLIYFSKIDSQFSQTACFYWLWGK